MNRADLFIEWSTSTYHTACLIPAALDMGRGFRSYFMWDAKQKELIEQQGNMANLDTIAVYSDTLFIDFDTHPENIEVLKGYLTEKNIRFDLYTSGSKGFHFHIPLDRIYQGIDLPTIHKTWVENLALEGVDLSIYRHAGLFRLPGTRHKKTGNIKTLIETSYGLPLNLNEVEVKYKHKPRITCSMSTPASALNECLFNMINEPGVGGRYMKFWKMAKMLQEAEYTREFAEELLIAVNFSWKQPKEVSEIMRVLGEVYGKS